MIEKPFTEPDGWIQFYCRAQLPVLRHTVVELDRLREQSDTVNGRVLAAVILKDPMMTMRVLRYIESHRKERQHTDITTIERAIMMIGIGPFFRDFTDLPQIETQLAGHPQALLGLIKVITRCLKAAHWAREWAILRHDLDVDEITVAALLRNGAEMLMWCFAPSLALKIKEKQRADKTLRSSALQKEFYQITLNELGIALAKEWGLPELITTLMDQSQAENPRVRNVLLATDLARHSANGWDDAALPDDYTAISELLHINVETVLRKIGLDEEGKPLPPQPQKA
ncbi:MAG TPA: HDOD domain-containing protein [Rhodocyclaceae bacterium]|jgi:HD-like signal output (HDOD) protein